MSALGRIRLVVVKGLFGLTAFTLVVNLLLLVQPIYMLQVYDRVLSSGSVDTLLYISLMAGGALVVMGLVDAIRSILAGRIAARMEAVAGGDALVACMTSGRTTVGDVQPLRDLQTVRSFIGGRAIFAYLDLPFAPLFIVILWFIHPVIFFLTLAGAVVLSILALANQWATSRAAQEANEQAIASMLSAQAFVRNAESIRAMGMTSSIVDNWGRIEARSLSAQDRMNSANAWFSGTSKILRMGLQIAILGVGGYLVLEREMSGGMIFAASIISGRGLQPIDQVIGGWKGFLDTRKAWERLGKALGNTGGHSRATELPNPVGRLVIDELVVMPPHNPSGEPLVKRVSGFVLPGTCMALIGPSGAGKSTLVRAIVGAVPIRSGSIQVDGADIRNWDPEQLGRAVGYLSQDVELLPGTIAQNIARFDPDMTDADVVEAARKAQVHDLIQRMPRGYDTPLGVGGLQLSGGQRQRVGLARAFYGSPKLIVLDEPNAHLDADGDRALEGALMHAKNAGVTVVIVTQRRNIAEIADTIMIVQEGEVEDFGPRQDVYARQAAKHQAEAEARRSAQERALRQEQLARANSQMQPEAGE